MIDEAMDLFDQALHAAYSRSKRSLKKHHEQVQENTNQNVRLLGLIGSIILDENVVDPELRGELYSKVSCETLRIGSY